MADELTGPARTLQQTFDIWITPEVTRRQEAGLIAKPFDLFAAQVLFSDDGAQVRLNEEVRANLTVRANRMVSKGDEVLMEDLEEIQNLELIPEDLDLGHITVLRRKDTWFLTFNALRNRASALALLDKADEFLAMARTASRTKRWSAFSDTLFSASELIAKAQLMPMVLSPQTKSHGAIHSKLNEWGRLGNTRPEFVRVFNRLSSARGSDRYASRPASRPRTAREDLRIVSIEARAVRERLVPKIAIDDTNPPDRSSSASA